jgi:homoserine dehydrogenase
MAKLILIGDGTVGSEFRKQAIAHHHDIQVVATSKRVRHFRCNEEIASDPVQGVAETIGMVRDFAYDADALMIAMPNGNKGIDEIAYMEAFSDKHIVTCAKAAHAYQFDRVKALRKPVGRRATVGGGTDLLETLRRRQIGKERVAVYAVLNGTLNYIWSEVQRGDSFMRAVHAAKKLGFAEPNGNDVLGIINGELADICMKASIVYNVALSGGGIITPDKFKVRPFKDERELAKLTSRNARYRFILTFSHVEFDNVDKIHEDTPGSIHGTGGIWRISGGFHDVRAESPWFDWLREMGGVNNGYTIYHALTEDTGYSLTGPGAGPVVTAAAMMRDLNDLLAS